MSSIGWMRERPSKAEINAALGGGIIAGLIDLFYACAYYGAAFDAPPVRIFQSIAAGWLGQDAAAAGGDATAVLGIVSHFAIVIVMAAVYVFASRRLPILTQRWALSGLAYGFGLWVVMRFIVVPLSAAPPPTALPFWGTLGAVLAHMVVGLVIAWFTARMRRES